MSLSAVRDRLRGDVAAVLGEEPSTVTDDENLIDRGLDSFRLLMLAARWRQAGFDTAVADLAGRPTIAAWSALAVCP